MADGADDHVDVGRTPRVAAGRIEHRADGTVSGDRVRNRADGDERVGAVGPGDEASAEVILGRLGTLHRIETVIAVLPHVELGGCDRLAVQREHSSVHQGWASGAVLGDALAELAQRRAGHVERAQNDRFRRALRELVLDRIDEHR